jgi:hypothetical protein
MIDKAATVFGTVIVAAASATIILAQAADPSQELPPLSALTSKCKLVIAPLGERVPIGQSTGIWLTCNAERFLVVRPENLLSKVDVRTPLQALEFVRFFSARATFGPLQAGGCVEVTDDRRLSFLYQVEPPVFRKYLKPATVETQGSETRGDLQFVVTRPLVCPDQRVYEISEQLHPNGLYFMFGKELKLKHAKTIGVVHLPAH